MISGYIKIVIWHLLFFCQIWRVCSQHNKKDFSSWHFSQFATFWGKFFSFIVKFSTFLVPIYGNLYFRLNYYKLLWSKNTFISGKPKLCPLKWCILLCIAVKIHWDIKNTIISALFCLFCIALKWVEAVDHAMQTNDHVSLPMIWRFGVFKQNWNKRPVKRCVSGSSQRSHYAVFRLANQNLPFRHGPVCYFANLHYQWKQLNCNPDTKNINDCMVAV